MLPERLTAQLLAGRPAKDPESVVQRLLAVQGQDPRGARLAVRARSEGLSAADVDRALNEGELLITWLNRGTLHMVRSEDYPWLHMLTAPRMEDGNARRYSRRLEQEGVSPADAERGVQAIERALDAEGPLTRPQLRERIAAKGVRTEGQAMVHLLILASLRGLIVRGPMKDGEHAYVLVREWLDPADVGLSRKTGGRGGRGVRGGGRGGRGHGGGRDWDRDRALAELARRYLAGHGPAGDRDLSKWAGLPLRDVRAGLSAIASELVQREDGLVDLARRSGAKELSRDARGSSKGASKASSPGLFGSPESPSDSPPELPQPKLLGAFDPLLHGWVSREEVLAGNKEIVTVNGLFRPFALVRGRAVAIWRLRAGEVAVEPFGRLRREDAEALRADAGDVVRFLGRGGGGGD